MIIGLKCNTLLSNGMNISQKIKVLVVSFVKLGNDFEENLKEVIKM